MNNYDSFGRRQSTFAGAFSADDALLSFTNAAGVESGDVPMLLQDAQFGYSQTVNMIYDLTSSNVYAVRGRAAGQGNMTQVLGPARLSRTFLRNYGSVCRMGSNNLTLTMKTDCTDESTPGGNADWDKVSSFEIKYVVLTDITRRMAASDMMIQQSLAMMYASMVEHDGAAAA